MTLPPLGNVIRDFGLDARKSLGQHFLLDGNITAKIARTPGALAGINVIEIGPGPGGLTRSLVTSDAAHVFAIETDPRCIPALAEIESAYPGRLTVTQGDALAMMLTALVPSPRAIVANLPYNIATPLLIEWLDDIARMGAESYRHLTLMFQKEVADRLVAQPGGKDYGRLSVMTQWLCNVEHCFDLPPGAFSPPPKVTSSVVKLTPLAKPRHLAKKAALEATLKAAFGQRRKMLRSALSVMSGDTQAWLAAAAVDPTRRAETLSIAEFCALARNAPGF